MKLKCLYSAIVLLFALSLSAQQKNDEGRLVRLIKAETAETFENELFNIRRVTGHAQFLHNNALIICDTAIWDVSKNTIDAIGNVKIIQEKTVLSGERIHYIADSSLAQVRGSVVELLDKDSNRLRTLYLDYNTKDSIAYFYNGGSMMDTAGKVIESLRGYYHSKIKRFKFLEQVEMSANDMILKSDSLAFWSQTNKIDFLGAINAWQKDGFISSKTGWYERNREIYNFEKDAYILNTKNEIWGDRILYQKDSSVAQLWNNVQIVDTAQSMIIFSDYAIYKENLNSTNNSGTWAQLYNNPSIAHYSIEKNIPDTLFFCADTINFRSLPKYLVDSATIASSNKRYKNTTRDPIKEMYGKPEIAIASTNQTLDSTLSKGVNSIMAIDSTEIAKDSLLIAKDLSLTPRDTTLIARDSTFTATDSLLIVRDSLSTLIVRDSLSTPNIQDSTLIRFIDGNKNVKFYRSDFQGKCDSLKFNSIDSIIRLYKEPVLWNDKTQLFADSIQLLIANNSLRKVDLISNAFVISPEDSLHYNQIKSTDMSAYFTEGDLSRFDAYGGVTLIIFIAEDSLLTTMNRKECKTMTAKIKNRQAERIKYIDNVPSDAYPVIDLKIEQKQLKGFKLRSSEKPKDRFDVCDRVVLATKREEVQGLALPDFPFTWSLFRIKPESTILQIESKLPREKILIQEEELPIIQNEQTANEKELSIKID